MPDSPSIWLTKSHVSYQWIVAKRILETTDGARVDVSTILQSYRRQTISCGRFAGGNPDAFRRARACGDT